MVIIRTATESDIPSILRLYGQLVISMSPVEETARNPDGNDYRRIFARMRSVPGIELVVAEDGGEVIGSLVLMIVPNLSHKGLPWALAENVIVDERFRRNGAGKLLMEYAIDQAKQAGCYRVGLSSDNRRTEAHEFYRSLGFEASAQGFRMNL